jgi:DNA-directed RNA polymerase subunit RPC12/RpoP
LDNHEKINSEDVNHYPCSACGANMVFEPTVQTLRCPYCENTEEIVKEDRAIVEYDFETAEHCASENWGREKKVIHCKNCGGEVVLDAVETANSCAFCGSSYIVKNDESAGIVPESLIPFKVSQKKALEGFTHWIKKRHFAPNALKTNYKCERMNGVYIPNWTYDADTCSSYTAEAGHYYYVTERYTENGQQKTRRVRKIRWSFTSGRYSHFFNDVLINASRQIEGQLMTSIEPFHLEELAVYDPRYLSGFSAERYSIGLHEGWDRARDNIDSDIRSAIRRQIHADEIRNLRVNTTYSNIKFKHILLPVWISAYTYKNKIYRYMVNGQTGEVQGRAPVSAVKIILLISAIVALCLLGYFLYTSSSVSTSTINLYMPLLAGNSKSFAHI